MDYNLWLISPSTRTDAITAIHVSKHSILTGTLLGRITCRTFADPLDSEIRLNDLPAVLNNSTRRRSWFKNCRPEQPKEPPNSKLHIISSFSDDSIRAIYVTKDHIVAIIGNALLKRWSLTDCTNQTAAKLDRRLSSTIKYVLQRGKHVLVPSQGCTISVDLRLQQICQSYFRLTDKDLVPCDFDGENLLIYSHYPQQPKTLRVYNLTSSGQVLRVAPQSACKWTLTLSDDPADSMTCAGLWGGNRCVVAVSRGKVFLYEWGAGEQSEPQTQPGQQLATGPISNKPIIAFGVQRPDILVGLTSDGVILIWDTTGKLYSSIKLTGITFSSALPPLIRVYGACIVFSSDSGVHMLRLSR